MCVVSSVLRKELLVGMFAPPQGGLGAGDVLFVCGCSPLSPPGGGAGELGLIVVALSGNPGSTSASQG